MNTQERDYIPVVQQHNVDDNNHNNNGTIINAQSQSIFGNINAAGSNPRLPSIPLSNQSPSIDGRILAFPAVSMQNRQYNDDDNHNNNNARMNSQSQSTNLNIAVSNPRMPSILSNPSSFAVGQIILPAFPVNMQNHQQCNVDDNNHNNNNLRINNQSQSTFGNHNAAASDPQLPSIPSIPSPIDVGQIPAFSLNMQNQQYNGDYDNNHNNNNNNNAKMNNQSESTIVNITAAAASDPQLSSNPLNPLPLDVGQIPTFSAVINMQNQYNNHTYALKQLSDALHSMDNEKCVAYRKAITQYPKLVEMESHPIRYLQFCKFDPWKAAERLCAYWQLRHEIFGPQRCYRPVTTYCPNTGAMSEKAITIMESGNGCLLLPDNEGCSVLFTQRLPRKFHEEHSIQSIHKSEALFYSMHLISAQPNVTDKGFRVVLLLNEKRPYPTLYPSIQVPFARICRDCFPFQLVGFHVVLAPRLSNTSMITKNNNKSYTHKLIENTLPYLWVSMKNIMGFTRLTLDLIQGNINEKYSYEKNMATLFINKFKLNVDSLPTQAGGTWDWNHFIQWFQIQQDMILVHGQQFPMPPPILQKQHSINPNDEEDMQQQQQQNIVVNHDTASISKNSNNDSISTISNQSNNNNMKRKAPSVKAMVSVGALEPLPIWYEQQHINNNNSSHGEEANSEQNDNSNNKKKKQRTSI